MDTKLIHSKLTLFNHYYYSVNMKIRLLHQIELAIVIACLFSIKIFLHYKQILCA